MSAWLPLTDRFRTGPSPDALRDAGFDGAASARVLHSFAACSALTAPGSRVAYFVPGRIEVLGKHTDYAGGRSLVCAVDRGFTVVATPRPDGRVTVVDANGDARADLTMDGDLPAEPGHWSDYARSVVRRLARDFDARTGADIVFLSDLPRAAGVSSSSALVIAVLLVLATVNDLPDDEATASIDGVQALAGYASAIENGRPFAGLSAATGVGTMGGSQDHTAILCARAGMLTRYAFAPVRAEGAVPLPAGLTLVVAASGVRAEKTAAALERYNRLAVLAARAAGTWRASTGGTEPHLGAILDGGNGPALLELLGRSSAADADVVLRRVEQFIEEAGTLVPSAFDALETGDAVRFGDLVARSQSLAETALENQIPETVDLVRLARDRGAVAASAFGAGFGGSVWALVPARGATEFTFGWLEAYRALHPDRVDASAFVSPAAPAALRLA